MSLFDEHLQRVRQAVGQVTPQQLAADLALGGVTLIDVRDQDEIAAGFVEGAHLLGRSHLESRVASLVAAVQTPIVLYCASGVRSTLAAATLRAMGYLDVKSLTGGFAGWQAAGLPCAKVEGLDARQRQRYARHIRLPEVGEAGQRKLLAARVLLVGAGGLGSPVALYLAAAGVGTLGIVDDDTVDLSNLQRQILHTEAAVGRDKVDSALRAVTALNSDVRVVPHRQRLTAANAEELVAGYDVIVDGADNFATRYLINDACALQAKPVVHAAIHRFEGLVSVFRPRQQGPCYRCLYPQPPPPEMAPNCAEAGVLGVLPGVVGTLQAAETLKLILGIGTPLIGRALLWEALAGRFRELKTRQDPACALCGAQPTIDTVADVGVTCASPDPLVRSST